MTHNRKTGLAVLFLGAALAATPAAASSFDGSWNVNITTRTGTCQSGASLPIRISNGRVEFGLFGERLRPGRGQRRHRRRGEHRSKERHRLRPPRSERRLRHLARRPVLRHLDGTADVKRYRVGFDRWRSTFSSRHLQLGE